MLYKIHVRKTVTVARDITEVIRQHCCRYSNKLWEINKGGHWPFVKIFYKLEVDWITEKVLFIAKQTKPLHV